MSVLITGSNGFLGTVLAERLLARGTRGARCLVRQGSDRARLDALQAAHPEARMEIVTGSLSSPEAVLPALDGVDTVYHLAAGLRGTAADLFLSSVVTSKNLLEAVVRRGGIKIVLVSSFGVYGTADLPPGAVVNEETPLERHPERRDAYSYAKLRQEQLFFEYQERHGIPLVVLRPGVIYGPGGSPFSARLGLSIGGVFFHLGGRNLLPLSYVENCAEAIAVAGESDTAIGQVYNVHDDDLPTCAQYLRRYRREVGPLWVIPVPYGVTCLASRWIEGYHRRSHGQLPALLTPYRTAVSWKGTRFSNARLTSLGWRPIVSTDEGLRRTFAALRGTAPA